MNLKLQNTVLLRLLRLLVLLLRLLLRLLLLLLQLIHPSSSARGLQLLLLHTRLHLLQRRLNIRKI